MTNGRSVIVTVREFTGFDCEAIYHAFKESTSDEIVQPVLAAIDV